ncbi:Alkaline phosphatase [hydrothermal vent metagenome]|uniref:Alkaline phosphatase n=1 Tax=hydrothermal vent metagenome TaxID=652676 RepID=A0A3B0Y2A5_9ZZZZ
MQADVGSAITVTASYTDGGSTSESVTSSATASVANVNDVPTGSVAISGSATQNQTLTASNTLIDADGLGTISYQWARGGSNISGATATTYVLVQADVGNAITVTASYTDGGSTPESVISSATASVANVNDSPTGSVTISGSATQGQTLTASNTLADADGLGTISYQWARGGTNISGATATTYVLVLADVGSTITVTVSYTDGGSMAESVTSSATATVVAGNSAPTISGTPVTSSGDKTAYSFTPVANDPDTGDTLVFSIVNKPTWAVFSTLNGGLSGTPGVAFIGTTSNIVISVDDGNGQSASLSAFSLTVFADLDGDDIADSVDTDIDGDGMDNSFETANGLDPLDPADAVLDTDGDGLTNLEEFQAGKDPTVDDVAPQVTPPADITLNATAYFTAVNSAAATALDTLDGALTATRDSSGQLRPGITTVTWSATDAAGNTGSALQTVNIVPLASISNNQNAAEGSSVNVRIILNGDAVQYPVVVPYTVSGTAVTDGTDHTLVDASVSIVAPNAGELPEASVSFSIVDDGAGEGVETIVITLGTPTGAILGSQIIHAIQVVEGNVAPFVTLVATQGASNTIQVDSVAGNVIVSANVSDPNASDIFSYDWSNTDNALIDTDIVDSSFTFDPTTLTPGFYSFNVQVSDGTENTTSVLTLNILSAIPVLDTTDSDGDGVDDISEGFTDEDSDGVADYLDAIMASNILQEETAISNQFLMEADPGLTLSLGGVALRANLGRSRVTAADIVNFSSVTNAPVDSVTNVGGIFDFAVAGLLAKGQSVQIVMPQIAPVPDNPVYRKLVSTGWQDFVQDNNNSLASAAGAEGFCPPSGDTAYQPGLNTGHWCVQVTIEDGGPNDTDGLADNRVTDPGGVGTLSGASPPGSVALKSSGGTLSPWFVFILLVLLFLRNTAKTMEKTA